MRVYPGFIKYEVTHSVPVIPTRNPVTGLSKQGTFTFGTNYTKQNASAIYLYSNTSCSHAYSFLFKNNGHQVVSTVVVTVVGQYFEFTEIFIGTLPAIVEFAVTQYPVLTVYGEFLK